MPYGLRPKPTYTGVEAMDREKIENALMLHKIWLDCFCPWEITRGYGFFYVHRKEMVEPVRFSSARKVAGFIHGYYDTNDDQPE